MSALGEGVVVMGSFQHCEFDPGGVAGDGGQASLERDLAGMGPWPFQGEGPPLEAVWVVDDWDHLQQAVW